MKKINRSLSLIFLILSLLIPLLCSSQNKTHSCSINFKIGFAGPLSEITFSKYWFSPINISLSGLKQLHNNLSAGLELNYCRFIPYDFLRLKSGLHIFNPNIISDYSILLFNKLLLIPEISLGYSWLTLTNRITPVQYLKPYNESGFSIRPGLTIGYLFKKGISLGLSSSYNEIFTRFGVDNSNLYENRKEADHISYLSLNLHLGFKI
jgi:hypothetical protein